MPFIRNKILGPADIALLLLVSALAYLHAEELPGHLTVIPDPGVIILDGDTLDDSGPAEMEMPAGEHLLRFFPLHTADSWAHRYLEYPFTLGAQGRRVIDLTRRSILSIRSEPQNADLVYRDRLLGRTPGEYLFLTGVGDSVLVRMSGFQTRVIDLDRMLEYGGELFVALEPDKSEDYIGQISADDEYRSPVRALFTPGLLISLSTGAGLLVTGVHFNREADRHYDRYLRLIGTSAREDAFSQAKRNDRISKTAFIAGDLALGFFGYLIIRRYVFKAPGDNPQGQKRRGLSFRSTGREAFVSLEF
ncbi:MAG: hypothetical protein JXQ83_10625 [Candidatus Glassbacteria bacterium]|nr:hypothetical protein [Candidatus Glassbacteria bacterium]